MGGSGSGHWYRYSAKDTVDGLHSLDINWLNRNGYLTPGRWSPICWKRGEEQTGSIGLRAEQSCLTLDYRWQRYGQEWENVKEPVYLTWTSCHYGGSRPWFICPAISCGRRVGKLYSAGKYFLCRHCYDLAYESQREDLKSRLLRKTQNIRRRLGGSASLMEPFPWKPKGMHWKTYFRLRHIAEDAEDRQWAILDRWLRTMRR